MNSTVLIRIFYVAYSFPCGGLQYMPVKAPNKQVARARFQNAIMIFASKVTIHDIFTSEQYFNKFNQSLYETPQL